MMKKIVALEPEYEVVATDLQIIKKGEKMIKDGNYYVNEDESVIIKCDNTSARLIKKIVKKND